MPGAGGGVGEGGDLIDDGAQAPGVVVGPAPGVGEDRFEIAVPGADQGVGQVEQQ